MSTTALLRILDASLNRGGEGLRVVEDYTRFGLDDAFLTGHVKSLRHDFAAAARSILPAARHASRDAARDVGTQLAGAIKANRADAWAVCAASLKRAEQALRSLEEYGKLVDQQFARTMESLRYRLYTLEKALDLTRFSRDRLADVRLCVLIDGGASARELQSLVAALVEAGVGMIQLREKRLDDRQLIERAGLLRLGTRGTSTLAIINDRCDVAAAVGADGVHLGQEDLSVKDARAVVGPLLLVGVSTHSIAQARAAVLDGANYLGAGPTFPSATKAFETFAGLEYLRHLAAEVSLPAFAIGGITPARLTDVLATGVTRVAVGAAITAAAEPASAARKLLAMLTSIPVRENVSASP